MSLFADQFQKMKTGKGFIAALDQSGGSTPKALKLYGIEENRYSSEEEMFDLVHGMRARIIKNPKFTGDRVVGAILFEMTMDRDIDGVPTAQYLWEQKHIVPFLKVDKGLQDEANGVQLMKPIPELSSLLARAKAKGIFGTKMRSVIASADKKGIEDVVAQQFEVAKQIVSSGLVPIIEPEVNIKSTTKDECEVILKESLLKHLNALSSDEFVMLKLTLPTIPNFYKECIEHPQVLRVVALSGGYSRDQANAILTQNNGMIASFSRAFTEGLSDAQTEEEFTNTIDASIQSIYEASCQ